MDHQNIFTQLSERIEEIVKNNRQGLCGMTSWKLVAQQSAKDASSCKAEFKGVMKACSMDISAELKRTVGASPEFTFKLSEWNFEVKGGSGSRHFVEKTIMFGGADSVEALLDKVLSQVVSKGSVRMHHYLKTYGSAADVAALPKSFADHAVERPAAESVPMGQLRRLNDTLIKKVSALQKSNSELEEENKKLRAQNAECLRHTEGFTMVLAQNVGLKRRIQELELAASRN